MTNPDDVARAIEAMDQAICDLRDGKDRRWVSDRLEAALPDPKMMNATTARAEGQDDPAGDSERGGVADFQDRVLALLDGYGPGDAHDAMQRILLWDHTQPEGGSRE